MSWNTEFIAGDVVKTKWGNAVISEASEPQPGWITYSVRHLPGHTPRIWENGIGHGPKFAWYQAEELELVAPSAAREFLNR